MTVRRVWVVVVCACALLMPVDAAFGAPLYHLNRLGVFTSTTSTETHTYRNDSRRPLLNTVSAAMPQLQLYGDEVGAIRSYLGNIPADTGPGMPTGLTSSVTTPTGPWCFDLSVRSLVGTSLSMSNAGAVRFAFDPYIYTNGGGVSLYGFGLVREPAEGLMQGVDARPDLWSSMDGGVRWVSRGYSATAPWSGATVPIDRQSWGWKSHSASIHAYGGSVVTTLTPSVRYWWKAWGEASYSHQHGAGRVPFSVDVTGSVTPPSLRVATLRQTGPTVLDTYAAITMSNGTGTGVVGNLYGASSSEWWSVFQTVGGVSEDSATVAYYRSVVPTSTGPSASFGATITVPTTQTVDTSEPVVPIPGQLPVGLDPTTDWFAQFTGAFAVAVDALLWPYRAFGAWVR